MNQILFKDGKFLLLQNVPEKPEQTGNAIPEVASYKINYNKCVERGFKIKNPDLIPDVYRDDAGNWFAIYGCSSVEEGNTFPLPGGFRYMINEVFMSPDSETVGEERVCTMVKIEEESKSEPYPIITIASQIFIDGDFNDSYESRVRRGKANPCANCFDWRECHVSGCQNPNKPSLIDGNVRAANTDIFTRAMRNITPEVKADVERQIKCLTDTDQQDKFWAHIFTEFQYAEAEGMWNVIDRLRTKYTVNEKQTDI